MAPQTVRLLLKSGLGGMMKGPVVGTVIKDSPGGILHDAIGFFEIRRRATDFPQSLPGSQIAVTQTHQGSGSIIFVGEDSLDTGTRCARQPILH